MRAMPHVLLDTVAITPIVPRALLVSILLMLLCVLLISTVIFWILVRQSTVYHHWSELSQWADEHRMRLRGKDEAQLPAPLANLHNASLVPVISLTDKTVTFIEMRWKKDEADQSEHLVRSHAAVCEISTHWLGAALQPAKQDAGLSDLFALKRFPSMIASDRFVPLGADSAMARRLALSKIPALLPPDVALVLQGQNLILDFSNRPFDAIELTRLSTLVEQLVGELPAPG
jgi:hypothetical protein